MIKRRDTPKLGRSFPFIESTDKKIALKYDAITVKVQNGYITMTFMQGPIPVFAYTNEFHEDMSVCFDGMSGHVDINFNRG